MIIDLFKGIYMNSLLAYAFVMHFIEETNYRLQPL